MKWSGAAEGDQAERTRVVAPLDGDDAQDLRHLRVDEANDAGGESVEIELGQTWQERFERLARALGSRRSLTPRQAGRTDSTGPERCQRR